MPALKFTPRNYYNAAQEHIGLAGRMMRQTRPEYFVAHFFAGIAVENILRALSVKEGDTFDGTHSIEHWARKARLTSTGTNDENDRLRAALDEINTRWRANQRYFTTKMLEAYLESAQLDKIRGDRIKYSAKRLFELAVYVVSLGEDKWQSSNKSKKS